MARVLNMVKLASQSKRCFIKMHLNKNDMRLIRLLMQLNFVSYIEKANKRDISYIRNNYYNYYNVMVNLNKNLNFKNLYRPTGVRTISYKELSKNSLKKKNSYILSTTSGFITQHTALKYRLSGILFMILY